MSQIATKFENVTVKTKANVYFDGKVVSHVVTLADGTEKTLGLIYPGEYHFGTEKAECMELVAGQAKVKIDGESDWKEYKDGESFNIPCNSGFDIVVGNEIAEYICSYID